MTTFTIDPENNIVAHTSLKEAQAADIAGAEYFGSQEELAQLAASWPSNRLIEIWNSLPGVVPVKKFKDRQTACGRIWAALAPKEATVGAQGTQDAPKATGTPKKATKGGKRAPGAPKAKGSSKKATSAKKVAPARKGGKKARPGGKEAREGSKKAEVPRTDASAERRHPCRDHEGDRLAGAHGSRLRQRHADQEAGSEGRVLPQR